MNTRELPQPISAASFAKTATSRRRCCDMASHEPKRAGSRRGNPDRLLRGKGADEEVAAENEAEYLLELGFVLREAGERAVRDAERARRDVERSSESDQSFHSGRLGTHRYVLSLMQQQAEVFGIPLEDLALDGFDPERDL